MRAVSTSLRRALHLGLALGSTALFCACPPNWDGLNPPGDDAGVVAPQDAGDVPQDGGTVDAGLPDAGFPDAGLPDAGLPDAGFPDAGLPDAGFPDAGFPDAGPDGGVTPFDGGPGACEELLPAVDLGWTCLNGGTYPACGPDGPAPEIVDIVRDCPTSHVLNERGVVSEITANGALVDVIDFSSALCTGTPPAGFRQLLTNGSTFVGVANLRYCVQQSNDETTDCTCRAAPGGGNPARVATLPGPNTLVLNSTDNITYAIQLDTGDVETFEAASIDATGLVTVTRSDGGFRAQTFRNPASASSCREIGPFGSAYVDDCVVFGADGNEAPLVHLLSAEREVDARTRFHFLADEAIASGVIRTLTGVLHRSVTALPIDERQIPYAPLTLPTAFAAAGAGNGFRAAAGGTGGSVLVAAGAGAFVPPEDGVTAGEVATIRVMARAYSDAGTQAAGVLAISDAGIYRVGPVPEDVPPAFTRFAFETSPVAASVVLMNETAVLVVGEETGVLQLFEVGDGLIQHFVTIRDLAEANTGEGPPNIPQAIAAVTNATGSNLIVLTAAGQFWEGRNLSATNMTMTLRESPNIRADMGVNTAPNLGLFVLSARAERTSIAGGQTVVYVTVGNDTRWDVRRYGLRLEDGTVEVAVDRGARVDVGVPTGDVAVPFRFSTSTAFGANTDEVLTWSASSGATVTVDVDPAGTILETTRAAASNLPTLFTSGPDAGANALRTNSNCNVVFSATESQFFVLRFDEGTTNATRQFLPVDFVPRAAMPLSASTTLVGGDGGHLFVLTHDGCANNSALTQMNAVVNRPFAEVTTTEWLSPDMFVVGDTAGALRVFRRE